MQNDTQNIIGVDVGSGSVRAGVFNLRGELLAHATREITLFRSAGNKVEQSSREIWQAVCYCIKTPARIVKRVGHCLNQALSEIVVAVKMPPTRRRTERPYRP